MSIPSEKHPDTFSSIRQLGLEGWNTKDDPQDLKDQELSDILNVNYDKGYPSPRKGSVVVMSVPVGETNSILNTFAARASDGTNFAIGVYAPNFYLWDDTNAQWCQINNTYTPLTANKASPYGYVNWNAGISKDVLYCGNGIETMIKWKMEVGYVKTQANSGATLIILNDSTKFGSSGTISIKSPTGGAEVFTTYSANNTATNTLTVPALGANVVVNSIIASQIASIAGVSKGKILKIYQGRLYTANQQGGESTINASQVGNAENFVVGNAATDPFTQVITDGTGGITGLDLFGKYLIIEKSDAVMQMTISIANDSSGASYKTVNVDPVFEGLQSAVAYTGGRIKYGNFLFFATETEGIRAIDPTAAGTITTVEELFTTRPIRGFVKNLDFTNSRAVIFDQKIHFSSQSNALADTIMVFDLLKSKMRKSLYEYDSTYIWTRYNGWPVKDWLIHKKGLYYANRLDNKIYQCYKDTKLDGTSPYEARIVTKNFDFTQPSLPKTMGRIFVSGYISPQETLNFDLTFITGSEIATFTYQLKGNGNLVLTSIPKALAMQMLGLFDFGMEEYNPRNGTFRAYLATPFRYGFYTLGIKIYSTVNGTDWGVTGLGFSPVQEVRFPAAMEIGVLGDPTNNAVVGGGEYWDLDADTWDMETESWNNS